MVMINKPNMKEVANFFNFPVIKILWNSKGSDELPGFGHSDSLKQIFASFCHKGDSSLPYTEKNML